MEEVSVYLLRPNDSPYFYAQWVVPGTTQRKTRSLKTTDPKQAERKRSALEYELSHGAPCELAKITWPAFIDRFIHERLGDGCAIGQVNARRDLERFGKAEKPSGPAKVTTDMISRHCARLRQEGLAPATIQTHMTHLRTAMRWAVRLGMAERCPHFEAVKVPKKRLKPHLTPARFPELLDLCPKPEWKLFATIAWYTGMRLGELYLLRWEEGDGPWLDLERKRVVFPAAYCKSRRDDWLPLHPDLLAILLKQEGRQGRVFDLATNASEMSAKFCAIGRPIQIRTHDLRRSFGTRYAPHVPAHILQRLMRHANIKTTLEYYADLDPSLDEAITKA